MVCQGKQTPLHETELDCSVLGHTANTPGKHRPRERSREFIPELETGFDMVVQRFAGKGVEALRLDQEPAADDGDDCRALDCDGIHDAADQAALTRRLGGTNRNQVDAEGLGELQLHDVPTVSHGCGTVKLPRYLNRVPFS
jgi:hypothetical protein